MCIDSSKTALTDEELCELGLREQIDVLWRYQSRNGALDPGFTKSHALMIVQLSDDLAYARHRKDRP